MSQSNQNKSTVTAKELQQMLNMNNLESSKIDEDTERLMNKLLKDIQVEQPKIDQSLKNFMTILLGKNFSLTIDPTSFLLQQTKSSTDLEDPAGIKPSVTEDLINVDLFTIHNLLAFVKYFLAILQELPLMNHVEYFQQQKAIQPETTKESKESSVEKAIQYLDAICYYKALYALRENTIQSNGKISKTFGKSYFLGTNIFEHIKERVASDLSQRDSSVKSSSVSSTVAKLPRELNNYEIQYLMNLFERSIFNPRLSSSIPSSVPSSVFEGVSKSISSEDYMGDLVWAVDFNLALQQRQQMRKKAVEARQSEQEGVNELLYSEENADEKG